MGIHKIVNNAFGILSTCNAALNALASKSPPSVSYNPMCRSKRIPAFRCHRPTSRRGKFVFQESSRQRRASARLYERIFSHFRGEFGRSLQEEFPDVDVDADAEGEAVLTFSDKCCAR